MMKLSRFALVLVSLPVASTLLNAAPSPKGAPSQSRRVLVGRAASSALAGFLLATPRLSALADADPEDFGELPLPSVRTYKQYRGALQFAGDYFLFELKDSIEDLSKWQDIERMMQSSQSNSGGQPSQFERLVLIPMAQIALSFPPDVSDELAASKLKMERALQDIVRATRLTNQGVAAGASNAQLVAAERGWQEGREALNSFYALVDKAIGRRVMDQIPASESDGYVRSRLRYTQFKKGLAICQNRGGSNLAGVWGGLMVYGTAVDPCGDIPSVDAYLAKSR